MNNKNIIELTKNEELVLEKNLIWIFGYPNFVVNHLSRLLSEHGNYLLNEPLICKNLGMLKVGLSGTRTFTEYRKDQHYFFSNVFSETWKFYLRKLILNRIHAQFQNLNKKIIINEPIGNGASNIISECFPDSKIIFVLPDDSSAINSFINELSENKNKLLVKSMSEMDHKVVRYVVTKRWMKLKEIMMEAYNHKKDLRYIVNNEKLINDKNIELRKIFNFLGIEVDDAEIDNIIKKCTVKK